MKKISVFILLSLFVVIFNTPSFCMKKRTGHKRKRSVFSKALSDRGSEKVQEEKANKKRKLTINDEKTEEIKKEVNPECSICMEDLHGNNAKVKKLVCDHEFHGECIDGWFEKKNSCPLCRNQEFCFSCKEKFDTKSVTIERHYCNHKFHNRCFHKENISQSCPLCSRSEVQPEVRPQSTMLRSERFSISVYEDSKFAHIFDHNRNSASSVDLQEKNITHSNIIANRLLIIGYGENDAEFFDLFFDNKKYSSFN